MAKYHTRDTCCGSQTWFSVLEILPAKHHVWTGNTAHVTNNNKKKISGKGIQKKRKKIAGFRMRNCSLPRRSIAPLTESTTSWTCVTASLYLHIPWNYREMEYYTSYMTVHLPPLFPIRWGSAVGIKTALQTVSTWNHDRADLPLQTLWQHQIRFSDPFGSMQNIRDIYRKISRGHHTRSKVNSYCMALISLARCIPWG